MQGGKMAMNEGALFKKVCGWIKKVAEYIQDQLIVKPTLGVMF